MEPMKEDQDAPAVGNLWAVTGGHDSAGTSDHSIRGELVRRSGFAVRPTFQSSRCLVAGQGCPLLLTNSGAVKEGRGRACRGSDGHFSELRASLWGARGADPVSGLRGLRGTAIRPVRADQSAGGCSLIVVEIAGS